MTTFICIRHGNCEPVGKYIAGRAKGIYLNDQGRKEVEERCEFLKDISIQKVFASPLERTCETAEILCRHLNLDYEKREELIEINYGDWTGKKFEELSKMQLWHLYNQRKSMVKIPDGEMIIDVEERMSAFVETARHNFDGVICLVSHGDPIKCLFAHYMGVPLDLINRIEIDTSSVSVIALDDYNAHIVCINEKEKLIKL